MYPRPCDCLGMTWTRWIETQTTSCEVWTCPFRLRYDRDTWKITTSAFVGIVLFSSPYQTSIFRKHLHPEEHQWSAWGISVAGPQQYSLGLQSSWGAGHGPAGLHCRADQGQDELFQCSECGKHSRRPLNARFWDKCQYVIAKENALQKLHCRLLTNLVNPRSRYVDICLLTYANLCKAWVRTGVHKRGSKFRLNHGLIVWSWCMALMKPGPVKNGTPYLFIFNLL